jgi:hypothetical protein
MTTTTHFTRSAKLALWQEEPADRLDVATGAIEEAARRGESVVLREYVRIASLRFERMLLLLDTA